MNPAEIEAIVNAIMNQCAAAACPLTERQQQILQEALGMAAGKVSNGKRQAARENPLAQLTPQERQAFLEYVRRQEEEAHSWRIALLNDWLQGRDSGSVQFIRDRYGVQWLEQITPDHIAQYTSAREKAVRLRVGDRIEVTNGLWEWVQETGPCSREWFPCEVVGVGEVESGAESGGKRIVSCIVRFENGAEYEIQGVYDWNRPNWRWLGETD